MNPALTVGRDGRFGAAPGRLDGFGAGARSGPANHADGRGLDRAPHAAAEPPSCGLVGRTLAEVERALILDTLDHCLGNRTQAAKVLGISIRTLRNKLNEYGAAGKQPDTKPDAAGAQREQQRRDAAVEQRRHSTAEQPDRYRSEAVVQHQR